MDWNNTSHVMQAVFWSLQCCIAFYGYSVGSRSVIS